MEWFRQLTGLPLHIQSLPNTIHPNGANHTGWCPTSQRRTPENPGCHTCQSRMESHAICVKANPWLSDGRRACGNCGLTSFWIDYPESACSTVRFIIQAHLGDPADPATSQAAKTTNLNPRIPEASFEHASRLLGLIHQNIALSDENQRFLGNLGGNGSTDQTPAHRHEHPHSIVTGVETAPFPASSHARHIAEAMMAYARSNYHHPMSLGDVASSLGMNASYLSHLFKTVTGMHFHKHLEDIRLSKARELLLDPSCHVCEVAAEVGYSCPDQFRHAFKARFGHPPSDFR